jgi:hypothetical protein
MKITYELFQNKDTKIPFQKETGELKRDGDLQYSRIGNIEMVRSKNYITIADHGDKNISVLGLSAENENPVMKTFMVDIENTLKICTKAEFKKENSTQNSYLLEMPSEEYSQVKIVYNSKTFLIEKLIMFYLKEENLSEEEGGLKEAPRLEITYMNIDTSPKLKALEFTYDKFLEMKSGKLVCREAYKGYELIDQSLNN